MKVLSFTLSFCALALSAQLVCARDTHIETSIECPGVGVLGFPIPITHTVRNTSRDLPHWMFHMDAATETDGWYAKGILVLFTAADGTVTKVGQITTGRPDVEFSPSPPSVLCTGGESITRTFDMNQLLLKWRPKPGQGLPSAGRYKVQLLCRHGDAVSEQHGIALRNPTNAERQYLASLAKQGIKEQWFPAIVTRDNLELPPSGDLPEETALLCDYIAALRLAVRNPAAALEAFGARSDWGFYTDPVRELAYECLVAVHGKNSEQATSKRAELEAAGLTGRLTRLDKDGGLLTRFGTIRQSE